MSHPIGLCMAALIAVQASWAQETLRAAADRRGVHIGAAAGSAFWSNEPAYKETLRREFNTLVAENAMKFAQLQPTRGNFRWTEADALVEFAQQNGMKVRGHTLVWGQSGGFAEAGNFGREELLEIMRTHIQTVMGRYRGKIFEWDVVNETIADGRGTNVYRDNYWIRGIGPEYVDSAFRIAHRVDPTAVLYYNDYRAEGSVPKADKIYALVKGLRERGVPIHGVGMQGHMSTPGTIRELPEIGQVDANIKRFAALGLKVAITEFDFRVRTPASEQDLAVQKAGYKAMLGVCLANPNCRTFVTWGFTDKYSFIPGFDPGWGAALPFDEQYRPKASYYGMLEVLTPTSLLRPRALRSGLRQVETGPWRLYTPTGVSVAAGENRTVVFPTRSRGVFFLKGDGEGRAAR